jgi:hypothetical protein
MLALALQLREGIVDDQPNIRKSLRWSFEELKLECNDPPYSFKVARIGRSNTLHLG